MAWSDPTSSREPPLLAMSPEVSCSALVLLAQFSRPFPRSPKPLLTISLLKVGDKVSAVSRGVGDTITGYTGGVGRGVSGMAGSLPVRRFLWRYLYPGLVDQEQGAPKTSEATKRVEQTASNPLGLSGQSSKAPKAIDVPKVKALGGPKVWEGSSLLLLKTMADMVLEI